MDKQIEKPKNKFKKKIFSYLLAASITLLPLRIKSEEPYVPKNLYFYNQFTSNLVCSDPLWAHKIENVCAVEFSKYTTKKNLTIPIMFVAYKDGRAGVYFLPIRSEKKMFYYEFENKFKVAKNKSCLIFEGTDEKDSLKFVYFRVVQDDGETINYGIPQGMF
jgi:hypothetical protein